MLGKRLEALRIQCGMSKRDVANALKIHDTTYGKYELGHREPDIETLEKLAECFNTTMGYIIGESPDPDPPQKEKAPALSGKEAIIALFIADKGREPTEEELNMFRAFTKPVLDSLPDKAD